MNKKLVIEDEEVYKKFVTKICKLSGDKKITKTDVVVLFYLMLVIPYKGDPLYIKQKSVVDFTKLSASDVSKSFKSLKKNNIIKYYDDTFATGYLLEI